MPRTTSKRKEILEAARKVFNYYGFNGSTLDRIAKETGVTSALVVKYYGSKENLAKLLINDWRRQVRIKENWEKPCREFQQMFFETMREYRAEWKFMLTVMLTPNLAGLTDQMTTEYQQSVTKYYMYHEEELQNPPEAKEVAYTFMALCMAYVIGGNEQNYLDAQEAAFEKYLK